MRRHSFSARRVLPLLRRSSKPLGLSTSRSCWRRRTRGAGYTLLAVRVLALMAASAKGSDCRTTGPPPKSIKAQGHSAAPLTMEATRSRRVPRRPRTTHSTRTETLLRQHRTTRTWPRTTKKPTIICRSTRKMPSSSRIGGQDTIRLPLMLPTQAANPTRQGYRHKGLKEIIGTLVEGSPTFQPIRRALGCSRGWRIRSTRRQIERAGR
jgi:hypothetical protein